MLVGWSFVYVIKKRREREREEDEMKQAYIA